MHRLSGFFFDVMIVAGIAAIDWENLEGVLIPLIIVAVLGGLGTFLYLKFVCKKIYPKYEHEAFFSFFGMLTGTASTGMILLRELDPNFETPAADNLVLQQLPAIIFGAPLLLIIGIAGKSLKMAILILFIALIMFLLYNLILLRRQIFKKKNK
jgi:ESS family glutamate:Na+ symporter